MLVISLLYEIQSTYISEIAFLDNTSDLPLTVLLSSDNCTTQLLVYTNIHDYISAFCLLLFVNEHCFCVTKVVTLTWFQFLKHNVLHQVRSLGLRFTALLTVPEYQSF